jgi:hypothetical protein
MKTQEESAMTRFILVVVAITLILVMIAVIRDKNQVKEPPAKPWINPDGSLPYETVKALAPDYIDSLERAGEIERWLKEHPQQNVHIRITIEDERW